MNESQDLKLPPLLTYPSNTIQAQILPEEWQTCLDLWIASVEWRLTLSDTLFSTSSSEDAGLPFLLTYLRREQSSSRFAKESKESKESTLDRLCFTLLKKLLRSHTTQLQPVSLFELLSAASTGYTHLAAGRNIIKSFWSSNRVLARKAIESAKSALATSNLPCQQISWLQKISSLTKALPETATITVASADYLDTLNDLYIQGSVDLSKSVTENLYYSFLALLNTKHITILTDNIYHMKSEADRLRKSNADTPTPLSSLLCTTSFLRHLTSNTEIASRKQTLANQLNEYRQDMLHLHPHPPGSRKRKGKERASKDERMHMHQAAQVSQIHELFPDLNTAYIMKSLDHFSDNVEAVIAALLEPSSLPDSLKNQDMPGAVGEFGVGVSDLAPRSTPPPLPTRKSVFDNDEFDRLQISSKQLRRGKKAVYLTEASVDDHTRSKAAIMSALAAFDSDDDERDDTYDVADVGGAVDNTIDTDERRLPGAEAHEATLFKSWKENSELFSRDSKTRASNIRQQFKRETGMSDEQIEGWAIILNRDKRMQDRLQDKYSAATSFTGSQRLLQPAKWQASISQENSENESGPERSNDERRMGQAGIRGHRNFGRGRGRGGGVTSGPPDAAETQAARKRKEQGRGRGGANNRRDARAKKVGRGMGSLPPS